jgi:hypothetical protein
MTFGVVVSDIRMAPVAADVSPERYNEAAVLVNNLLFQGPPRPDDKPPMPLRPLMQKPRCRGGQRGFRWTDRESG